jgi:hypothetical protein
MRATTSIGLILLAALASVPAAWPKQQGAPSSSQTASPQQQPPPKPSKKPEEPIDPDATAGVRGSGAMHTVRVIHKGKPVPGAHVVVKNANGSLAASCYTNASGECQVQLGADNYVFHAKTDAQGGTASMSVTDASGPIIVKLHKVRTDSDAPKT